MIGVENVHQAVLVEPWLPIAADKPGVVEASNQRRRARIFGRLVPETETLGASEFVGVGFFAGSGWTTVAQYRFPALRGQLRKPAPETCTERIVDEQPLEIGILALFQLPRFVEVELEPRAAAMQQRGFDENCQCGFVPG